MEKKSLISFLKENEDFNEQSWGRNHAHGFKSEQLFEVIQQTTGEINKKLSLDDNYKIETWKKKSKASMFHFLVQKMTFLGYDHANRALTSIIFNVFSHCFRVFQLKSFCI